MPWDFALLSMTDFRNRPGDVLDRVANDGDKFIIESNGKRKACLVPLSVFFPDVSPQRVAIEMEELLERGEDPRATFTEGRQMAFKFDVSTSGESPKEVLIFLPDGYPHSCPKVYVSPLREDVPHRWADGALCLYGVMTGWNPGKHTVFSTLNLARRWLESYDVWDRTGKWPQEEDSNE
jgi:prevent-host-death family protein